MTRQTTKIAAGADRQKLARSAWSGARVVKRDLRSQLVTMCFRPAFCMYCHESRGTDVDHFVPIARDPMLTFEWTNHVLACGFCNQQAKKEHFPLDTSGHALLLDPGTDDSADHLTLSTSGEFIDLTARGAETIALLGLNKRSELVQARSVSWEGVVDLFERATRRGRNLAVEDLEKLRFLPVVDALHHFAHDITTGRLRITRIAPEVVAFASRNPAPLEQVFPTCTLT